MYRCNKCSSLTSRKVGCEGCEALSEISESEFVQLKKLNIDKKSNIEKDVLIQLTKKGFWRNDELTTKAVAALKSGLELSNVAWYCVE